MLSFGESNQTSQYLTPQGEPIESKESVKSLAIIFQSNVNFDKYIINIVTKFTVWQGCSTRNKYHNNCLLGKVEDL